MAMNPQAQSGFISVLPREIRDAIYLELWRSCGLRQHIVWHSDYTDANKSHLCRWACTTEYHVEDQLQQDIEALRKQLRVPLGHYMMNVEYSRRLKSPYLNHWACGEHAAKLHGDEAMCTLALSGVTCSKKRQQGDNDAPARSPYIPMLLSCKIISVECLLSIYGSTTFVLADMQSLQTFIGYCEKPPLLKNFREVISPPALLKYTKHLELSLTPNFPLSLACADPDLHKPEEDRHNVYDFHWLSLDRFQCLKSIKIWIAARAHVVVVENDRVFTTITELDVNALKKMLSSFAKVPSVAISTPLSKDILPEDGYVEDISQSSVRLWKRGAGDRFHCRLWPRRPGDPDLHELEEGPPWHNDEKPPVPDTFGSQNSASEKLCILPLGFGEIAEEHRTRHWCSPPSNTPRRSQFSRALTAATIPGGGAPSHASPDRAWGKPKATNGKLHREPEGFRSRSMFLLVASPPYLPSRNNETLQSSSDSTIGTLFIKQDTAADPMWHVDNLRWSSPTRS
ncbi:hypothetical protein GX51_04442 [Blastomyces parvus]|uniref:Uncharacterized protein n=1 Tax=Blastomyces parvus TaxID=2060905 RepID=A0A2B7X1W4_9EURO|nr:hypothetical protein GX51_04442 [Blastomyces parvus]